MSMRVAGTGCKGIGERERASGAAVMVMGHERTARSICVGLAVATDAALPVWACLMSRGSPGLHFAL